MVNGIVGKTFNRLTVISEHKKDNIIYCFCVCLCGNVKDIRRYHVISSHIKSCGCLSLETSKKNIPKNKLPIGKAPENILYHNYKKSAEQRKYSFDLNRDQFINLIYQPCHYCNRLPQRIVRSVSGETILANGVDRINNDIGYVLENCVSCCSVCNRAKGEMTIVEFKSWIRDITSYLTS